MKYSTIILLATAAALAVSSCDRDERPRDEEPPAPTPMDTPESPATPDTPGAPEVPGTPSPPITPGYPTPAPEDPTTR